MAGVNNRVAVNRQAAAALQQQQHDQRRQEAEEAMQRAMDDADELVPRQPKGGDDGFGGPPDGGDDGNAGGGGGEDPPVAQNTWANAPELTKLEMEYMKTINYRPFYLGKAPFSRWSQGLFNRAVGYNPRDFVIKLAAYNGLAEEAQAQAEGYQPSNFAFDLSPRAYVKLLQDRFEPASESEQARLDFESRVQLANEIPSMYYQDKEMLFKRAYPAGARDWIEFYDKAIAGLTNERMQNALRQLNLNPFKSARELGEYITRTANMVRRQYLHGQITEAQAFGAEASAPVASYTHMMGVIRTKEGVPIKQEPGINAISALQNKTAFKGKCFHCEGPHMMRDCPSRNKAVTPAAAATSTAAVASRSTGPNTARRARPFRFRPKAKGLPIAGRRRVQYCYTDPDGEEWKEVVEDQLDDEHETLLASIKAANEEGAVLALEDEDFDNEDFLGVGH